MDGTRVRSLYLQVAVAIAALGSELGIAGITGEGPRSLVYDVQPQGFYRLGKIEEFREELFAQTDDPLAQRFAEGMPDFYFVQDGDEHVTLTAQQRALQDFNCSNGKFTMIAIYGQDPWTAYGESVVQSIDADGAAVNTRILVNGKCVGFFADDTAARGRWPATINPKAADAGKVARAAYQRFRQSNRASAEPMPAGWAGTPN